MLSFDNYLVKFNICAVLNLFLLSKNRKDKLNTFPQCIVFCEEIH